MANPERKAGRPRHCPTEMQRRLVQALAAHGVPQREIGLALAVDPKTLRKCYRRELDVGAARLECALILNLMRIAGGNDETALKAIRFTLRARFGWSEFAPRPAG
ncbi:RNA polymerase subunit sigma-70 [Rhizobium ruizarguesonis]